jgi:hypothetical protein
LKSVSKPYKLAILATPRHLSLIGRGNEAAGTLRQICEADVANGTFLAQFPRKYRFQTSVARLKTFSGTQLSPKLLGDVSTQQKLVETSSSLPNVIKRAVL